MSDLFEEIAQELGNEVEIKAKSKSKRPLSEQAKKARMENLRKGREKRMKLISEKKKLEKQFEFAEESSESEKSESESDEEEQEYKKKKKQKGKGKEDIKMKAKLEALESIVHKLKKTKKEKPIRQPVVINNQLPPTPQPQLINSGNNEMADLLKKRILNF